MCDCIAECITHSTHEEVRGQAGSWGLNSPSLPPSLMLGGGKSPYLMNEPQPHLALRGSSAWAAEGVCVTGSGAVILITRISSV